MTQKKAEILLATVIAARATSLLFSKIAMNGMGIFNLLAARFLMAFVLLAVVFFKRLRHIKRHTLVRGAIMGGLFFLMPVSYTHLSSPSVMICDHSTGPTAPVGSKPSCRWRVSTAC